MSTLAAVFILGFIFGALALVVVATVAVRRNGGAE